MNSYFLKFKKFLPWFLILVILAGAFWLRRYTFWLPHWKGDQNHYISLAMKLDRKGFDGYNLREIKIHTVDVFNNPALKLVYPDLGPEGSEGDILQALRFVGQGYYNEPLHMRAPLFSYALMWSHRLFAQKDQPFVVSNIPIGESVRKFHPPLIMKAQLWAVIVPLFFNLTVIFLTFLLGKVWFSDRSGLVAALIMATNPVSLMTAQRILSEDFNLFFMLISLFLFFQFFEKKKLGGVFIAGMFAGAALLVRQTSGVLFYFVWIYSFLARWRRKMGPKEIFQTVFNREFMIYAAAAMLVSGFWFIKIYQMYGNPLYTPAAAMKESLKHDVTGWFRTLAHRSHPVVFFTRDVVLLCPLFAATFLTTGNLWKEAAKVGSDKTWDRPLLFLWLWVLAFYLWNAQPWRFWEINYVQEHRYFYPAYPAIALLAATGLEAFKKWISFWNLNALVCDLIVLALLALNAWYCVPAAERLIFSSSMLM